MPARKREYRPGKNIFRPGKVYAGPGNAEVDPRSIYAGRDIKYAGQVIKCAGRDIKYADPMKSSAGPEMPMQIRDSRMTARASWRQPGKLKKTCNARRQY
jgi:hypothetical protein